MLSGVKLMPDDLVLNSTLTHGKMLKLFSKDSVKVVAIPFKKKKHLSHLFRKHVTAEYNFN